MPLAADAHDTFQYVQKNVLLWAWNCMRALLARPAHKPTFSYERDGLCTQFLPCSSPDLCRVFMYLASSDYHRAGFLTATFFCGWLQELTFIWRGKKGKINYRNWPCREKTFTRRVYGCPVFELGAAEAMGHRLTNSGLIRPAPGNLRPGASATHAWWTGWKDRTARVRPRATAARRIIGALLPRQIQFVCYSSAAEYSGAQCKWCPCTWQVAVCTGEWRLVQARQA
jgi:hypothetical protein